MYKKYKVINFPLIGRTAHMPPLSQCPSEMRMSHVSRCSRTISN